MHTIIFLFYFSVFVYFLVCVFFTTFNFLVLCFNQSATSNPFRSNIARSSALKFGHLLPALSTTSRLVHGHIHRYGGQNWELSKVRKEYVIRKKKEDGGLST